MGHQLIQGNIRIVDGGADRRTDLPQVVRGDVGCHTDGDAVRTVEQEVRDLCGKNHRFFQRFVKVRREVNRVLVDIRQEILRERVEADLGITHCSSGITVNGAEVSLPVDQCVPVGELLCHLDDGVIYGRIPMGVILTHDVSDHPCTLLVGLVMGISHLPHGKQGPAVHGFETITDIRDGTPDDDAHCIGQIGGLHLLFDGDRDQFADVCVFVAQVRRQGSSPPWHGAG